MTNISRQKVVLSNVLPGPFSRNFHNTILLLYLTTSHVGFFNNCSFQRSLILDIFLLTFDESLTEKGRANKKTIKQNIAYHLIWIFVSFFFFAHSTTTNNTTTLKKEKIKIFLLQLEVWSDYNWLSNYYWAKDDPVHSSSISLFIDKCHVSLIMLFFSFVSLIFNVHH